MSKLHVSSELERTAVVFYLPAERAFWRGPKVPPGRLRQAKVFHYRVPVPPEGTVPMLARKARRMLNAGAHSRFLAFVEPEDREFFDRVSETSLYHRGCDGDARLIALLPLAPKTKCEERGGCFGGDCCLK